MIGMTSALIAWLLPFWSKGTYHQNHLKASYRDGKIKIIFGTQFYTFGCDQKSKLSAYQLGGQGILKTVLRPFKYYATKLELLRTLWMILEKSMTGRAQDIIFLEQFRLAG